MLDSFNRGSGRLKTIKATLWNRTGTTLTPGSLVAFNSAREDVSGQAMAGLNQSDATDGAAGYILGAAIAPTTINVRFDMAVVDDTVDGSSIADNAQFTAILSSPDFPVLLEGSSGIGAGELFVGTNGQYYGTGKTSAEVGGTSTAGAASVFRAVGQALEAGGSGSAARKRCRFWGGLFPLGLYTGIGAS